MFCRTLFKWPKLSFDDPEGWVQHAASLQNDFNALHEYLDANGEKGVPKYLFNILYSSFSNFNGKVRKMSANGSHSAEEGEDQGRAVEAEVGIGNNLATTDPAPQQCEPSAFSINDGLPVHGSANNESDEQAQVEEEVIRTGEADEIPDSTEESDTSSAEDISVEAETSISDVASPKEDVEESSESDAHADLSMIILIDCPHFISRIREVSSFELRGKCNAAI